MMSNFEKVILNKVFFENLEITFWDSLKKHRLEEKFNIYCYIKSSEIFFDFVFSRKKILQTYVLILSPNFNRNFNLFEMKGNNRRKKPFEFIPYKRAMLE